MFTIPIRSAARALTVAWVGFWGYFLVVAALGDGGGIGSKALVCILGTAFFVSNCSLVWLFEHAASLVLVSEGVILTVMNYTFLPNSAAAQMFLMATLCLPPLAVGLMLLKLTNLPHRPVS